MKVVKEHLALSFLFALAFYFAFFQQFLFNAKLFNNAQYLTAFFTFLFWILFSGVLLSQFFSNILSIPPRNIILLFISNILIVILLQSEYYSFSNEYMICFTSIFLFCNIFLHSSIKAIHLGILFFFGIFLFELYLGFKQMGFWAFNIGSINIEGSLQNSGVFCSYLVVMCPFIYYLFFEIKIAASKKTKAINSYKRSRVLFITKRILFIILIAFILLIVIKSKSRTSLIAFIILAANYALLKHSNSIKFWLEKFPKNWRFLLASLFLTLLGIGIYYLFFLKKMSSYGRLLKLQIAYEHFWDFFWWGTGVGRFTWYYPQWQIQYFKTHTNPPVEYFLTASDSFVLFNEFIELFKTVGILGFIIFILALVWFFSTRTSKNKSLLIALKLTVVAILACGFTSYPLHTNILLLILAFSFAGADLLNEKPILSFFYTRFNILTSPYIKKILISLNFIIAIMAGVISHKQWQAQRSWDSIRNGLSLSSSEKEYKRLYPILNTDGKFLTEYGMFLSSDSSNNSFSTMVLREGQKYFLSRANMEALGKAYKNAGNTNQAINSYDQLSNYIPSKFILKLELLKLYIQAKDTPNARKISNTILKMPVKIPSVEVEWIKEEVKSITP